MIHPKQQLIGILNLLSANANDEYFLNTNTHTVRGFVLEETNMNGLTITISFRESDKARQDGYYKEHIIYTRSSSYFKTEIELLDLYNMVLAEFFRLMLFLQPSEYYSPTQDKTIKCIPIQDLIKKGIS